MLKKVRKRIWADGAEIGRPTMHRQHRYIGPYPKLLIERGHLEFLAHKVVGHQFGIVSDVGHGNGHWSVKGGGLPNKPFVTRHAIPRGHATGEDRPPVGDRARGKHTQSFRRGVTVLE